MSIQVVVLKELTLTAPLGLRFWDVATGTRGGDALMVIAYPDAFHDLRTTAIEGPGGVYSFSGLPGLRDAEYGAGDDDYWKAHPPTIPYTIEVYDPEDRYLHFHLSALLPIRGLLGFWSSPLFAGLTPDPTWIPLFSTPSRPIPGPYGMLRAQLQDDLFETPAAWALLTAQAPGIPPVMGLSDPRGMLSMSLPYPEPTGHLSTSPLSAPNLKQQTWPVQVSVLYDGGKRGEHLPDLLDVLRQGAAVAWRDTAHSAAADTFHLQYGKDLVLRSLDSTNGRELPTLLITPAGSPP